MPWFSMKDGPPQMLSHETIIHAEEGIAFRSLLSALIPADPGFRQAHEHS